MCNKGGTRSKKRVVLLMLLVASIAMAIVPVSVRMRGLGLALVGIVDDEYSDLFFNPAFINKIEGTRIYTNLSNVQGSGDDLLFSPYYSPYMYYNLLGGITTINEHKVGALIEMGGANWLYSGEENYTDIYGSYKEIDSMNYEFAMKNTDKSINLFWGKTFNNLHFGAWIGPHMMNMEKSLKYKESYYYYYNDTMYEYDYEQSEMLDEQKTNAYPFMLGVISGEVDNELSACLSYGYDRTSNITPTNFLYSDLFRAIFETMSSKTDEYEKIYDKYTEGGFYLSLNGRNKRRCEDHSLSFLANIIYVNQPIKETFTDTVYEIYTTTSGYKEIESGFTTQTAKGTINHFRLGLGVGYEKYFDVMNSSSLFAIGFLPSFFSGTGNSTIEPVKSHSYYFHNLPDTLEYISDYTDNETLKIKNPMCGFSFTFPVGIETHLTEKLSLRLGVTEDILLTLKNAMEVTLIDGGWTQHYVSGAIDTIFTEPANELDSYYEKSESKVTMSNNTTYHYGLGYKINDHIELNLLNFSNLTNLSNWVLGVNIKF